MMNTISIIMLLCLGLVSVSYAQSKSKFLQVQVQIIINAPIDSSFNYVVPIDLSHIFKRYKRFPAIIRTDEKQKWITAGLSRTVFFEDGTTAQETLMTVKPTQSFSYQIKDFTSQLRFLARKIEGDWLFTEVGNGQVEIVWTYKIIPKNFIARFIIKNFILKDIKGLLSNALLIIKQDLENGN